VNEGFKTWVGQRLTQRWHAVHVSLKCPNPFDPGGQTGFFFLSGTVEGFPVSISRGTNANVERLIIATTPPNNCLLFLSVSGNARSELNAILLCEKLIPPEGQTPRQLKQFTHREASMVCVVLSMHSALQEVAQRPHLLQCILLIATLNSAYFDIKPSIEPTGQSVLQNNRPCHIVANASTIKIPAE